MEKTRSYTGLFIITPDKEDQLAEIKKGIDSVISDNSGKIERENMIGKRKLAYPINKKTEGIYYEVTFSVLSDKIMNIKQQYEINTNVLRTIIDKAA